MNNTHTQHSMITRSDSFESFKGILCLEDDCCSLMSMTSADAVLEIIKDSSDDPVAPPIGQVINIRHDDNSNVHDDDELDMLLDPLQDLDDHNDDGLGSVFAPEQELKHLHQISPNTSHDWSSSHHGDDNATDQVAFSPQQQLYYDDQDISSLMTGELIELEDAAASSSARKPRAVPSRVQQQQQVLLPGPIVQILAYLHHYEPNRQLVVQAEEMVRDCVLRHQSGKQRKYQNLSGAILEQLLGLFGGPRFQIIYLGAKSMDPSAYLWEQQQRQRAAAAAACQRGPSSVAPNTLQLAIAYGMHLGKLAHMDDDNNGDDADDGSRGHPGSAMERVHSGVASLNSMTEKERQMFWNYATMHQG